MALYRPPEARTRVEAAAKRVAAALGLSSTWLNPGGVPWVHGLPDAWESRLVTVFRRGVLVVHAIGRFDMLVLKLLAGRAQDIEDLEVLRIQPDEVDALAAHLHGMPSRGWPGGAVDEALALLESLTTVFGASRPADGPRAKDQPNDQANDEANDEAGDR